jgi:AcrR family transcriptional regulator
MSEATSLSKGEQSRLHIIETANRLFYERGYQQTSFSDIAEASGIRRGNITYYFKTKNDILQDVIRYRMDGIRAMLEEWEKAYSDPSERLKRFAQMIVNSGHEIIEYGCPMGSLNTELGKNEPELSQESRLMFDLFREWLTRQFQALGFRKARAGQLALHLLGRGQGISVMAHVYHDPDFLKKEVSLLKQWIDELAA